MYNITETEIRVERAEKPMEYDLLRDFGAGVQEIQTDCTTNIRLRCGSLHYLDTRIHAS